MSGADLGSWDPLGVADVVALFRSAPFRWWISGGHALELHLGRSWRVHEDTDVGVCRDDVAQVRDVLTGWDLHVAAAGVLGPWAGQPLRTELHQNNLWCRREPDGPWALDVTIGEGDASSWVYRRDPAVRLPWSEAVLHTIDDVPYLAPELQLLFKSKGLRAKDDLDASEVIPEVAPARRERLAARLPPDHPWQRLLGRI